MNACIHTKLNYVKHWRCQDLTVEMGFLSSALNIG